RALGRLDIYPVPESQRAEPRVHLAAERHDDPPLGRPREPPARVAEADAGRLDPTLWRRHLGQPSLPGMQLADKGFESAGSFGELAHHALVVSALVAHPREQRPPLRGLAVDLRLLGLGFGVQSRQLLLAPLFATLAIGAPVRCPTILPNQTSIQPRQAREV